MLAYAIRRILLMIPTFIGILIINFAVLRLQGPTLVEQMQVGSGGQGGAASTGERKAQGAAKDVENYIDRFRRSGIDLPALMNVRGWYSKEQYVAWLRDTVANGVYKEIPSKRNKLEKELWLSGPQGIPPLLAILQDPSLSDIHAPTAQALSYCAYVTLSPRDLQGMSGENIQHIQRRNETLRNNRIFFTNSREHGMVLVDTAATAASKREMLIAVCTNPVNAAEFKARAGSAVHALFFSTGFCDFITKLFTGDLYSESRKDYVFSVIADRWSITFWLNSIAILIAWLVSIPLGIRSARRVGTLDDRATTTALFLAWSMPAMFLGTLLLYHLCTDSSGHKAWFPNRGLSSENSLWMPTGQYLLDLLWHAALPLFVLSYASFTALSRYMRANLLEQLDSDYVRTARAKGCSDDQVVYGHATRNSLITMITLGSGLLAELFSGALIVELIFSIPGLGWLMLDAAIQQDGPLLMGTTVISVSLLLFGILIADLLYAVADPRLRSRYG
jgi:peptide/nickel transport system permease protein